MLLHRRTSLLLGSVLLSLSAGCLEPTGTAASRSGLAPTMDRLVAAYPDLSSKRFRVLADFEAPEQGTLFRLEPRGAVGGVAISTDRARPETGVGALRISLAHSTQQAIAGETPDSRWALLRDWSGHHLLLFSIFSPRPLGGFSVSVSSGVQTPLSFVKRQVYLNQGWNVIRIDLGDMSDQINLGDVRELRFWCDPLDTAVDLYLDDLIIVDNGRDVFVPAEKRPGELYVREQGHRLVVGATDRFELVFSQGRIRQWFDLVQDPQRIQNLAGAGSIGPSPVVLPLSGAVDNTAQWSGLGGSIDAGQRLVESTALRVVVQGDCRFSASVGAASPSDPYHQWIYSVYGDGRVYVQCSGTRSTAAFSPAGVGVAFGCDATLGFSLEIAPGQADAGAQPPVPFALFSRRSSGQADLLVVPAEPLTVRALDHQEGRVGAIFESPARDDLFALTALMRVWPADIDSLAQAEPIAMDYRHPLPMHVDAGRLVHTDLGDADKDGFSEAHGYYVLQLDGNIAKVRIDGRSIPRFSPVFKLIDVGDRDVWAYLEGRQIRTVYRDAEGNVFFQVPGIVSREALLEVTSRKREPATPRQG